MKHLSEYINESIYSQHIDEGLGFGNLVKIFKRMFMPWTDEAVDFYKKTWKKVIWENVNESVEQLKKCKQIWNGTFGKLKVNLYDCHTNKKIAEELLNNILNFKENPNIFILDETPSKKNTGFAVNIYLDNIDNGLVGLFVPGQNDKLSCLMNFTQESSDMNVITQELKTKLEQILKEIINHLK